MPDIKSELMKLDNLQFDDDVSPITKSSTPEERKKLYAERARERYHANKKIKAKLKPVEPTHSVQLLLEQMPIKVAKELYLELKKVFAS